MADDEAGAVSNHSAGGPPAGTVVRSHTNQLGQPADKSCTTCQGNGIPSFHTLQGLDRIGLRHPVAPDRR